MEFGHVETNIETVEQLEALKRSIAEWYVLIYYPGYEVKEVVKESDYIECS